MDMYNISGKCLWPMIFTALLAFIQCSEGQISDQGSAPEIASEIIANRQHGFLEIEEGVQPFLSLNAKGTKPLQYFWLKDESIVENSTSSYYRIQRVQVSDSGVYRCIVENAYGSVRSLPFTLKVTELGDFKQTPAQNIFAEETKFVLLDLQNISYIPEQFQMTWYRDDVELSTDSLQYHMALSYDLAILDVSSSLNNSIYKAKAIHTPISNFKETTSSVFNLRVTAPANRNQDSFTPPEFVITPQNRIAHSGQDVTFECVINARPATNLEILWYYVTNTSRRQLSTGGKYSIVTFNRILRISSLTEEDSGIYECEGTLKEQQVFSPVTHQAVLSVMVAPSITSQVPAQVTKDFQESFVLPCEATGSPSPQVIWYFNGKVLSTFDSGRFVVHANGTLEKASVDMPDSGVYQCFAISEAGEAMSYTQLTVNSAEPTMVIAPQDKVVAEHEDTEFTCQVKGGPKPDVHWTKDNVTFPVGGRIRLTEDKLLIGRVEMSDSGVYACHAVNIKGSVSAYATLTIIVKTQIIKPPQGGSRIISTDTKLDCGVRSDPSVTPVWTWYFYQAPNYILQELSENTDRIKVSPTGTLIIEGLIGADSGRYECVVTSAGGDDRKTATINVIDLPAAPVITSIILYPKEPNSVLLNWTLSYEGDTPITRFIIQWREESSSGSIGFGQWNSVNSNVDPNLLSMIVGDLHPSRYYRFRVIAVNLVGQSPPSVAAPETEAIRMPPQPPSEAPRNLFCKKGGEQEIEVEWDPPPEASWNGDLMGYLIFYKVDAFSDATEKVEKVEGKDTRQKTITNLAYFKKYRVKIAAYNEKGGGVNSSVFYVTTLQGRPAAPPQNVTLSSPNSTTIRAVWNPPPARLINGVNQGYEIYVTDDNNLTKIVTVYLDEQNPTGTQTHDIVDLSKFTLYKIQIACRTARGTGPSSNAALFRTQEDVPGPVSDLIVVDISDQSLRISWRPPQEVNGILTGYEITHQIKSDTSSLNSVNREPDSTTHTFKGLYYKTTYIISVRAKTIIGPGPASTIEIDSGVPPEIPGPPSRLAVTNIEARSVLLQFIPGFDGKTTITLWIVEAQIEDRSEWEEVYTVSDPFANEIVVRNLQPYTHYKLRIIAKNIVARSIPSEPCNQFQTKQAAPGKPPDNVTPRAVSSKEIRIRWRQIERSEWNGDFLGYKIRYRRWSQDVDVNSTAPAELELVRETSWSEVELRNGSSIQEHTLVGLEEWMDYEIQMLSFNAVGNSQPSPTKTEKTEEDVPSASPVDIQRLATSSTSIFIIWSPIPILQQNGNIKGYKVKYRVQWVGSDPVYQTVEGASTLNVTLNGLRKFVEYDIQVLAFTRMGDGVLSPVLNVRTAGDVPGPPVNVYFPEVTDTSATIKWQEPDEPNGIIIMYRVAWRRQDEPDSVLQLQTNSKDKGPLEFEYSVEGLDRERYVFSVVAKTENGWGEPAVVEVFIFPNRDIPDAPYNLRIDTSQILARSVTMSWIPGNDNFGPVRNFTIEYQDRISVVWNMVDENIGPESTKHTVSQLQPNMGYKFRVAATNDVGTSAFSEESAEIQTLPDKPDGAPQNVRIKALTRTSIRITWEPPPRATWNGQLLKDIIEFREEGAVAYREKAIAFNIFNATLKKMTAGVKYEIRVLTANNIGRGPPSVLQVFRVGDVAPFDAPLNVRVTSESSTELKITWKSPPENSSNGEIIGYTVLYWESPNDTCVEKNPKQLAPTKPVIVLVKLKPYTFYCSTVQAVNVAGDGPKSVPIAKRTLEDYPQAPHDMRFKDISLNYLTVLWDPPQVPNGKIIQYQLQYYVSIDERKTEFSTREIPGNVTEQYVQDLLEAQTYTFSLAAYTSVGMGNVTEKSVFTGPQEGSPESPLQPQVTYKTKYILLTWQNQGHGYSPIHGYFIRYQGDTEDLDKWTFLKSLTIPETSTQIEITNLKPSTDYRFRVWAINSQGISPPSPPSELYKTPSLLIAKKESPFHTQWWFLVIVALSGVIFILLVITLLFFVEKRRHEGKLKRSTTATTVMFETPEPVDGGFPSLELRQSHRSLNRNGKTQNNIYARSPPRPSPASVAYSGDAPPHAAGATAAAAAIKPPISDDTSSVLSDKPSDLGGSSDEVSSDESDDSGDSIAKAPVPSSPPPPAFSSSQFRKSSSKNNSSSGAGASTSSNMNDQHQNPSWRFQNPSNAYAYTDSEAESSHYAFSLNNGNLVVNNVAGARTPLSGFSSFV